MARTLNQRMTAEMDGDFVVFLIGMRINRPWMIWKWWPVVMAMVRMLFELKRAPDIGLLGVHNWFGRTIILVQYWRSYDALEAYAAARDKAHLPAWAAFNRAVGSNGDVGIWHETYVSGPGRYENVYNNMPPFGLGAVGQLVPATGRRERASGRMTGET